MKPTNRHGTPVDPVPFLVVASFAVLVSFSFGPIYCLALGLSLPVAIGVSTVVCSLAAGVAYHRLVWTTRPELRGEVPADQRLKRLLYAALVTIGMFVLLTVPFLRR
ncbi:hypothetical protein [Halococcus agarilyticus]|uniref:hypothetical protein n=1 Tax=Halococcus agarilyticus TaxID=1232219 RepID=UPI000678349B|nr:hypothetical protein [Halococcus agarilyticus]